MIKRFKTRFISLTMGALFALLFVIFGTINTVNFIAVDVAADQITFVLAENNGTFHEPNDNPEYTFEFDGSKSPEMVYSTRYFTVRVHDNSYSADVSHIRSVDEDKAIEMAMGVKGKATGWTEMFFRYRVTKTNEGELYIFIDQFRELALTYRTLAASVVGGFLGLGIVYVLLLLFGGKLVRPFEENQNRQAEFISNSSHQLKTPLTIISANNELMELEYGESEYTQAIQKQVHRLTDAIQNLTFLSKYQESQGFEISSLSLSRLVAEEAKTATPIFASQKKELRIDVHPHIDIKGEKEMLRQMLVALIDNASKYSKTYAEVKLFNEGMNIVLSVKNDTEYSDPERDPDSYFERFQRGEETRASSIEGSGIGLSLVKKIAEIHKGIAAAKVEEGTFQILITFPNALGTN